MFISFHDFLFIVFFFSERLEWEGKRLKSQKLKNKGHTLLCELESTQRPAVTGVVSECEWVSGWVSE